MRHIKSNYLRSTMIRSLLNHLVVLNIYKEQLGNLDMVAVANEFVSKMSIVANSLESLVEYFFHNSDCTCTFQLIFIWYVCSWCSAI